MAVSIGNYHPRKGHHVLVDAAATTKAKGLRLGFIIVGDRSDQFCAEVEARGLSDVVKFAGVLPVPGWQAGSPDPLADLLVSSRYYISSSMDEGAEGLSLALLEGMAAHACPVVTNISGNRDVIHDGNNGRVVEPRNSGALADALIALETDPAATERLAQEARKTAGTYGWDVVAKRYLDLYKSLVEGNH
ncbi:MAG: glycosyltransferase [Gammaproteobacteria bacterium]|nr:glycosyltransferase [Gammaproteobacteria bacterium]